MRPQHEVLIAIIRPRNFKHFAQSLGKSLGVTREGAKFIGLHQGQPVRGGLRVFGRKEITGQTLFLKKNMTVQTLFWETEMAALGLF